MFNSLGVARNASSCFRSSSSFRSGLSVLGSGVERFFGLGGIGFLFKSNADGKTVPAVSSLCASLSFASRRGSLGARFGDVTAGYRNGLRGYLAMVCTTEARCRKVGLASGGRRRGVSTRLVLCRSVVRGMRGRVFGDVGVEFSGSRRGGILRCCGAFCRGLTLEAGSGSEVEIFAAGGSLFDRATLSTLGVRCVGNFDKKLRGCFGPTVFGCA